MGESGLSRKMGMADTFKKFGYCCGFLSVFGVILLGILYVAESNYTERLGHPCKNGEECTHADLHKNQDDAAKACMGAMIFYVITFVLSLGCVFGCKGDDGKAQLVM